MSPQMQTCQHSSFNAARLQSVVEAWAAVNGRGAKAPRIEKYEDFTNVVPVMTKAAYVEMAEKAWRERDGQRFYVGGSSGTTSRAKLVLSPIPPFGSAPSEIDRGLVRMFREVPCIKEGDVAANLFAVSSFSLLHHSMCRIVEVCRANVLPAGTLEQGAGGKAQLEFMAACGVNVLLGCPSSLIQVGNTARKHGIQLNIERILFCGEVLSSVKERLLKSVFPAARIIGVYGASECGFIGIGENGDYRIREDAYFIEFDPEAGLLLTSLDLTRRPLLLRYAVGDRGNIVETPNGFHLTGLDRVGIEFNFSGNLIEFDLIQRTVGQALGTESPQVQLTLKTDADGRDWIAISVFEDNVYDEALSRAKQAVAALPEIREGLVKEAGGVSISCQPIEKAEISCIGKQKYIVDLR
jgi:phenylacetate-coenzyme A ligase PaaK-like adenylate-forming protein